MKLFRIVASMTLMFGMCFSMYAAPDINETNKQREATNNSDDTVSLVTSGTGKSKEEATNNALRSALEQAYGTFVSSNTQIVNDELTKDEIVSIASGNIQGYNELSCVQMQDGLFDITVKAVVSIGKLVSFAESHGSTTELAGNTFLKNRNLALLNRKNEGEAIDHLINKLWGVVNKGLYDFSLDVGEPRGLGNEITINVKINAQPNANMTTFFDMIRETLDGLSMSQEEIKNYNRLGIDRGIINTNGTFEYEIRSADFGDDHNRRGGWNIDHFKPIRVNLRSDGEVYTKLENSINYYLNIARNSFCISDNLGLSIVPIQVFCKKDIINEVPTYRYYYYDRDWDWAILLIEQPINDLSNPSFEYGRGREDFILKYTSNQLSKLNNIKIENLNMLNIDNCISSNNLLGIWFGAAFYARLEKMCYGPCTKERASYHEKYEKCINVLKSYFQDNPITPEIIEALGSGIKKVTNN